MLSIKMDGWMLFGKALKEYRTIILPLTYTLSLPS
jgi:hypothetical protein